MTDISHQWGSDLTLDSKGDLTVVAAASLGQQRVLRRLLTTQGDYIWQRDYGAGLARFIGQPGNALQVRAIIRSQIFKEATVARTPEPVIDVNFNPAGATGTVYVHIRYVDAESGNTQTLSFSVSA